MLSCSNIIKDKSVGITIFEEQLLRVYFLSDNFELLRDLSEIGPIVIFTRPDLKGKIQEILSLNGFDFVSVIELKEIKESSTIKLLLFMLKWIDPSRATIRSLHRERTSSRITLIGFIIRKIINYVLSNQDLLKICLRKIYILLNPKNYLKKSFFESPPKLDYLFVTSLTNIESDLKVAMYYRKMHVPVIATVRSWDNLVTKGILAFSPDIFLSHSSYMTETAISNHSLNPKTVRTIVTPCYQEKFKLPQTDRKNRKFKIAYGCIGPFLNPDEINFIRILCKMCQENSVSLTIIQHPKFQHNLRQINLDNINVISFDYLDSTLTEYYSFLAMQEFIISSGTSLALDALFSNTPILALEFEIETQNYWLSHLRSYDFLPHTKKLFDNSQIPRIENEKELFQYISKQKSIILNNYFDFDISMITGDKKANFNNEMLRCITDLT